MFIQQSVFATCCFNTVQAIDDLNLSFKDFMMKDVTLKRLCNAFNGNPEVMSVFELLVEMVMEIDRKLKSVSGCGKIVEICVLEGTTLTNIFRILLVR